MPNYTPYTHTKLSGFRVGILEDVRLSMLSQTIEHLSEIVATNGHRLTAMLPS